MYALEATTPIFDALTLNAIATHADLFPNSEVCGLIVQDGDRLDVIEFDNAAADPKVAFILDEAEYKRIVFSGAKILAVYHSHWSDEQPAQLGFDDIRQSKRSKLPYLLYHTAFKSWDYFDPANINPFPLIERSGSPQSVDYYLGWQWQWNRADCYTLMKSYFEGLLGIKLADYDRCPDPSKQNQLPYKSFDQGMPEIDFVQLPYGTPLKDHDVLLFSVLLPFSHHCGVVTSAKDNQFIHHWSQGRLSEKEAYGSFWKQLTTSAWRHKFLLEV